MLVDEQRQVRIRLDWAESGSLMMPLSSVGDFCLFVVAVIGGRPAMTWRHQMSL
jgi:hypothetical protein